MNTPFTLPTTPDSPFRVPEAYFSDFTSRMMARIPEPVTNVKPLKPTIWQMVRPYLSAAAVIAVIALGTKAMQHNNTATSYPHEKQLSTVVTTPTDSQDELYSYLMLDEQSLYNYQDELQ